MVEKTITKSSEIGHGEVKHFLEINLPSYTFMLNQLNSGVRGVSVRWHSEVLKFLLARYRYRYRYGYRYCRMAWHGPMPAAHPLTRLIGHEASSLAARDIRLHWSWLRSEILFFSQLLLVSCPPTCPRAVTPVTSHNGNQSTLSLGICPRTSHSYWTLAGHRKLSLAIYLLKRLHWVVLVFWSGFVVLMNGT